ncbi:hypothetical protein BC939DRAFT_502193 [Gamsiella multidivaricata]|uniref:uncharacterized protein n=1 Tax=Gamsiella multidivaricata TaxID=101098 RepID=UPI002220E891|nr:uncharacterized protein BC939DRAFT_502193 [Gamsiella multidivaricata]KAG0366281.1 hypothetical protein BGZ54_005581 [Gamsiella multidivaricata]KAI7825751.1 hypothetical protein BC939DRAFT_502193 [Gamsiella multidivaricata]
MSTEPFKPHVLIVGAGLGGLVLAAILEKGGYTYEVFERASGVKLLGSALALGPGIMPLFEQLGVLDELLAKAQSFRIGRTWNQQMEVLGMADYGVDQEEYGYDSVIVSRPALHQILLTLTNPEKVHYGKRVLSHVETGDGVMVRTADGQTHHGNILVGADGAYSSVRQSLYEYLDKHKTLPKSDKQPLKYSTVCLVGQTKPLDPAEWVGIGDKECRFDSVHGEREPYFWVTFTTADNTICWMVLLLLDVETSKIHSTFRNSEWGPEAAESMANDVRDFPVPSGENKTLGDLIDLTPKELISKVMLEEKFFKTWYDGRTVLLGDACHKMTPYAGLGALNAMQDSVVLANYISMINKNDSEHTASLFHQYQIERAPLAKAAVNTSAGFSRLVDTHWYNIILRRIAMKYIPKWVLDLTLSKSRRYRPQVAFLPPANDKGLRRPTYQRSLEVARAKLQSNASKAV